MTSDTGVAECVPDAEPAAVRANERWLRRTALALVTALVGLSYAWALDRDPLEPYYAAAVRSMSMSWHNLRP
jgi:4-amino-4-deoxy-L-arabinose transferase-like glycosyltransferase